MADIDTIWELLTDVDGKCDELLAFKIGHEEHHRGLSSQFEDVQTTLWDKRDGLSHRIERLELNGTHRKSSEQQWRSVTLGIIRTIVSAAIIGLAVWLLCLYRYHRPISGSSPTETSQPVPTGDSGPRNERAGQ